MAGQKQHTIDMSLYQTEGHVGWFPQACLGNRWVGSDNWLGRAHGLTERGARGCGNAWLQRLGKQLGVKLIARWQRIYHMCWRIRSMCLRRVEISLI